MFSSIMRADLELRHTAMLLADAHDWVRSYPVESNEEDEIEDRMSPLYRSTAVWLERRTRDAEDRIEHTDIRAQLGTDCPFSYRDWKAALERLVAHFGGWKCVETKE